MNRVFVAESGGDLVKAVQSAIEYIGLPVQITNKTRVSIKPNLTYPYYKRGVTTSPEVVREVVRCISKWTNKIAIVESDGGYGAWDACEAFQGHGLYQIADEFNVEIVNLCKEEKLYIDIPGDIRKTRIPLPKRLLKDTDLFISMPVPKIHCMTGVSLGFKNQWGCIPDTMRLRQHYRFHRAIVEINRVLRPVVISDGTFFLDRNGPMDGEAVKMDLIIAATSTGAFDRYVTELMGVSWKTIKHLRIAEKQGEMPERLEDIEFNVSPDKVRNRNFILKRTLRNYIALLGFKSRLITWLGYESWFGKEILHRLLYAFAGKPVKPKPEE